MVGVNVRQKKIIEIPPSRRLHVPQDIRGDPFSRPDIGVGFLRRRNFQGVLCRSRINENCRGVGAENKGGIATAVSQMVNV